nr:MAG TPA: hypothetical protein [Caudoviricetes sp.]
MDKSVYMPSFFLSARQKGQHKSNNGNAYC